MCTAAYMVEVDMAYSLSLLLFPQQSNTSRFGYTTDTQEGWQQISDETVVLCCIHANILAVTQTAVSRHDDIILNS